MEAAQDWVRILIRRPHAYSFLDQTYAAEGGIASAAPAGCVTANGTELPLPGLYLLDESGTPLGALGILDVPSVLSALGRRGASAMQEVSIQVAGFVQAEGIT